MNAVVTDRHPVECRVIVDGQPLPANLHRLLQEVQVHATRRGAATCRLQFVTWRQEDGRWAVQDSGLLRPWSGLAIEACFGDRSEQVLRGYIRDMQVSCPEDMRQATVVVNGQDESLMLDRRQERRTWSTEAAPSSDGQLARQIASEHGMAAVVEPGLTHGGLVSEATPVRLLQERAEANGFEFYIRAGTLHFCPVDLNGPPQPALRMYGGPAGNCLRLDVHHDGHRPDQVRVMRWAQGADEARAHTLRPTLPLLGRDAADSSTQGLGDFVWEMPRPPGATDAEALNRAQAKADENAWKLQADGELDGALYGHVLRTHETVEVDGLGPTYDGLFYVDEVQHHFSMEGYRQQFKLLRNATGRQSQASAVDPLRGLRG